MKKVPALLLATLVFTFLITGCQKKIDSSATENTAWQQKAANQIMGVQPHPLDWEHINFMPTPPGMPVVPVPWGSGASRQFASEMVSDYKSSDGWTLVYNTFNTTTTYDNWYFILYNIYRGIIRMYYYIPSNANFINSTNVMQKLATEGSYAPNSPMLNFADQSFVDVNTKSRFANSIEQWQVARSTWYALQYELAYDQNMATQNYFAFHFLWQLRSSQITNIKINGTATGSIAGSINMAGNDFTISPTFNIDASRGKSTVTINGSSDADKLVPTLGQSIVSNIKSGLLSGAQGLIKNLLSGVFKRKTSTPEENVNLKVNLNISLNGQLTSDFLISSPAFSIPGYDQSSTPTFEPAYNEPLGVFYITQRPHIGITKEIIPISGGHPQSRYTFAITPGSYQFIFNPSVTSRATISNIRAEIILDTDGMTNTPVDGSYQFEPIDLKNYCVLQDSGFLLMDDAIFFDYGVYLRVSFDVVPNNGSPAVRIAKTFTANYDEF